MAVNFGRFYYITGEKSNIFALNLPMKWGVRHIYIYIYMYVVPSGSMCQFLGFSGLNSENSLFYSVLRWPAMFETAHHKPTKSLFLQYLQLVLAKFLGIKHFVSVNSILHYVFCHF